MSKIIQFSTIGALMAGHFRGECCLQEFSHPHAFGLGCSEEINGELTIFQGEFWEATAGEALKTLGNQHRVPFIQMTEFHPEYTYEVQDISHHNAQRWLAEKISNQNVFLAICIEAEFEKVVVRRPQRATQGERKIAEVAKAQQVDTLRHIKGRLIGFWTPELFGRISVPGFHLHFIDDERKQSGHVLEYYAKSSLLSLEEKQTIEITNPASQNYKELNIDITKLDQLIHQIEK